LRAGLNYAMQMVRRLIPRRRFENFVFIVGAQKAGTSSLHAYLVQHPDIVGACVKETHFFNREIQYAKGFSYYMAHFPSFSFAKYVLDATPAYLYSSKAPERIRAFSPKAKIVILLREPVARAFSAFNMYSQAVGSEHFKSHLLDANSNSRLFYLPIADGKINPDIDYFLEREKRIIAGEAAGDEPALIRRGIYAPQIQRYLDLFGPENVLVLFSEDLRRQTPLTVNRVFDFLGLDHLDDIELEQKHVRDYSADPAAKEEIQAYAAGLFAQDRQELIEKYHLDVPW